MTDEVRLPVPVAAAGSVEELHKWLGRREAFSTMAGRCSAADVECIRRMRDEKLYLSKAPEWGEFCENELHMSKSSANRLIGALEKFGAEYFQIAQVTKISAAEYAAIAPKVCSEGIAWNGELIPLVPENRERISIAVSSLKASVKREPSARERLARLDAAAERLLKQYREMGKRTGTGDPNLSGSVAQLQRKVERLAMEIG